MKRRWSTYDPQDRDQNPPPRGLHLCGHYAWRYRTGQGWLCAYCQPEAGHQPEEYVMDPASDPRPDLFVDSHYWSKLLPVALLKFGTDPEGPFWVLQGMRCMGGNLELRDGVARLRRGWIEPERYEVIREEWLRPHLPALRPLLENPTWAR